MKRINVTEEHSLCVQPAFLIGTYDENGVPNFAPITWVSKTWDTDHSLLVISMFGSKKTKENLAKNGMLSANLVSVDMLELMDYFGSRSGKDGAKDGLPCDVEPGAVLRVPTLSASRWVCECTVDKVVPTGDSDTYFCRIANVQHIESLKDTDGVDLTQLDPVIYSGKYHSIGTCLGKIGDFSH